MNCTYTHRTVLVSALAIMTGCSSTSVTQVSNLGGNSSSQPSGGSGPIASGGAVGTGGSSTLGGASSGTSAASGGVLGSGGIGNVGGATPPTGGVTGVTLGGATAVTGGTAAALVGGNSATGGVTVTLGGASAAGSGGVGASGGVAAETGGALGVSGGSSSSGGSMGTGGSSAAITGGAAPTGGAGTGGQLSCTGANMVACNNACVDISTTPAHCGNCNHDCGGGGCALGACQPMDVYTASLPIRALAVSRSDVFFSTYDDTNLVGKLLACPPTGCTLTPRQLVTMQYPVYSVAWLPDGSSAGIVVFLSAPAQSSERPALFPCPDTGCSGTPTSAVSDGLGGFDSKLQVVGNKVYYNSEHEQLNVLTCESGTCTKGTSLGVGKMRPFTSNGAMEYYIDASPSVSGHTGYILGCDLSQPAPCTPSTVLAADVNTALDIQVVGTTLYWLMQGNTGLDGRIRRCTLPGCSPVTDLVNGLSTPKEMLLDDDGAYIVNSANVIQRCNGTTCVGGVQDWVTGTAPHLLRSDPKFVYWADGNRVRRIAK